MSYLELAIVVAGSVLTTALLGPPLVILIYDWWTSL